MSDTPFNTITEAKYTGPVSPPAPAATATPEQPPYEKQTNAGKMEKNIGLCDGVEAASAPTPETDKKERSQHIYASQVPWIDFARRLERERDAYFTALHQCLAATGDDAGDADDFRALVGREHITVKEVIALRRDRDGLAALVEELRGALIDYRNKYTRATDAERVEIWEKSGAAIALNPAQALQRKGGGR